MKLNVTVFRFLFSLERDTSSLCLQSFGRKPPLMRKNLTGIWQLGRRSLAFRLDSSERRTCCHSNARYLIRDSPTKCCGLEALHPGILAMHSAPAQPGFLACLGIFLLEFAAFIPHKDNNTNSDSYRILTMSRAWSSAL